MTTEKYPPNIQTSRFLKAPVNTTYIDIEKSSSRTRSLAAFKRACEMIPGGVNSPARAFGAVGGHPVFMASGKGQYLHDLDGNQYLDFIGSWGPMILGHAHPPVIEAITKAAERGTSFGAPTENETHLAELISRAVPSIEKVRLVSSGTEATMSAIRLARGATGRERIIKFSGCYHGHVDSLLVAAGSAAATLGAPDSPGVTRGTSQDTIVLDYNNVQALQMAFDEMGSTIAGVILEPIVGNMGTVIPTPPFLKALRELCTKHGSILIFDEVMTGFRVAYGGAQSILGITPDVTTLGKIVGGGLPLAAYGGRADLMDNILPIGKVYQAGTLSGNPLATAAGAKTLEILRDESPYAYLETQAKRLGEGLAAAADEAGYPNQLQRMGSMMTLFFNDQPIVDWPSANRSHRKRFAEYFWGLINEGVYMPCSQFEALFFSREHTPENIEYTIDAAKRVLKAMASRE